MNNYYLHFTHGETEYRELLKIVQSHKIANEGQSWGSNAAAWLQNPLL